MGPLTRDATRVFQGQYNRGVFHSEGRPPLVPNLERTGDLDTETQRAICDAYVSEYTIQLSSEQLVGPSFSGCGEFNPVFEAREDNRRVILALYDGHSPAPAEFPCKEGDASVCPVDAKGPPKCRFYRDNIALPGEPELEIPYFDFQWLPTPTGRVHLSAITTLPDTDAVRFSVHRCVGGTAQYELDASGREGEDPLGAEVATFQGKIARGVCHATWSPRDGQDPFELRNWFAPRPTAPLGINEVPPPDHAFGTRTLAKFDRYEPPVFRISNGDSWGHSLPPGFRLDRVVVEGAADTRGIAVNPLGAVLRVSARGERVLDHPDEQTIGVALAQHKLGNKGH